MMASQVFQKARLLFNYFSMLLLLALTVFWFFLLIANPELFTHWKAVIAAVISWGTTAYGLFRPRVQKRIQKELPRLIEQFGYVAIWMFAVASLVYISYTLPIHRLVLTFDESEADRLRDPATQVWLKMDVDSLLKPIYPDAHDSLRYPCDRRFRFNQVGAIVIAEKGDDAPATEPLWWPSFPIFGLFTGTDIPVRLRSNLISVHVKTGVHSAVISVESHDVHFEKEGKFEVARGDDVRLTVTAPQYQKRQYLMVDLRRDTIINVPMNYQPINVTFVVRCEAVHIDSARVRIVDGNGNEMSGISDKPIPVPPGRYDVYIEKPYRSAERFIVNPHPFPLVIHSGRDTVVECRAVLAPI